MPKKTYVRLFLCSHMSMYSPTYVKQTVATGQTHFIVSKYIYTYPYAIDLCVNVRLHRNHSNAYINFTNRIKPKQ